MQCRQPSLEGTGEIPLRRLVKEALRMRPRRLVVGEVRQAEALDLLIALNSGLPGMCTIHANSAREAVTKMCTLPLLAGENVSASFVVPTVASSVDLVVHLTLDRDGVRRVREIVAVPGRVERDVVETADIFTTRDGALVRADGFPPHEERFVAHGFDLAALLPSEECCAMTGALVGLLLGAGLFCIWWSFWPAPPARSSTRAAASAPAPRRARSGRRRRRDPAVPRRHLSDRLRRRGRAGGCRYRRAGHRSVFRSHGGLGPDRASCGCEPGVVESACATSGRRSSTT